jgi:hypothetical protein
MPIIFTLTVFLSAALLFTVEPLAGKSLLPLAGGTPAVWTTCLLFFQTALLAGYAYAHAIGSCLSPRGQFRLHLAVIVVPLVVLPLAVRPAWFAAEGHPVAGVLAALALSVGLPFFALASTAPLMQRWAAAALPKADPYPLYAASNAGSLLALMAYPFLVEPELGLREQGRAWSAGYLAFIGLTVACARRAAATARAAPPEPVSRDGSRPWVRWLLLSLAPSSLLMSVTATVTTDVAPVPLLWTVPLALYLLTFVIAFAGRPYVRRGVTIRLAQTATLAVAFVLLAGLTRPWPVMLALHLAVLFFVGLACHSELARLRPPPAELTRFFVLVAAGGALGGLLNAVIAPVAFRKVGLAEYPLVLALAVGLWPERASGWRPLRGPAGWLLITAAGLYSGVMVLASLDNGWNTELAICLTFGPPVLALQLVLGQPRRLATGLVLLWLASLWLPGVTGPPLFLERNYFGTVRVTVSPQFGWHDLVHGATLHGSQMWSEGRPINRPMTYYAPDGPVGDIFATVSSASAVGVGGLGAGSLAYYAKPGQPWTFYEIDPAVVRIAQNPDLFSFLTENFPGGAGLSIVTGDARLGIDRAPPATFGLIVLDAFNSDAVPVHLLTREAIALYLDKLAGGGMIAFHTSNFHLDLNVVLAAAARDLKLAARCRIDNVDQEVSVRTGRINSVWVVLARAESDLRGLDARGWRPLRPPPPRFRTWTDDFSNLLSVFYLDAP